MTMRMYYLRNQETVRENEDGSITRGEPVALIVSEFNRENGVLRYAVATVHPNDTFDKRLARHIATERLNGVDSRKKSKAARASTRGRPFAGAKALQVDTDLDGHQLTRAIVRDIFASNDISDRLRGIAASWLLTSRDIQIPKTKEVVSEDERPTIPAPPPSVSNTSRSNRTGVLEVNGINPDQKPGGWSAPFPRGA